MIHYTCDRCCRKIEEHEIRYSVRLEAQATLQQSEPDDPEESLAQLNELREILGNAEHRDNEPPFIADHEDGEHEMEDQDEEGFSRQEIEREVYQAKRFDLCRICFQKFMEKPFGADQDRQVDFSAN